MAKNSDGNGRPLPIKVLSGQLRDGTSRGQNDNMECSVRAANGRTISVSMVWMQGTVLEAKLERNMVLLLDETGTFAVQGVNNIPKGKPCLSQGTFNGLLTRQKWVRCTTRDVNFKRLFSWCE